MIDFTWTPGVPAHLLDCGTIVPAIGLFNLDERIPREVRAGFHGDGWVRTDQGEKVCRWWIEVRERGTIFSLKRKLRLDPARMSAVRLRKVHRKALDHLDYSFARLVALRDQIGDRVLFYYKDGDEHASTYGRSEDGVWGGASRVSECPIDNDRALAAEVWRRWIRHGEVANRTQMIGWALLKVIASQLPKPTEDSMPKVIRIGDEVAIAEVRRTQEMNAYDQITAWKLRFDYRPEEVTVK